HPADQALADFGKQKLAQLATEVVLHDSLAAPRPEEDRQTLLDVFESRHGLHVAPSRSEDRRETPAGTEKRAVVRHGLTGSPPEPVPAPGAPPRGMHWRPRPAWPPATGFCHHPR